MLLVSVDDVKTFLEKSDTDTAHDALIGLIIEYVSSRIEEFLNRNLSKEYRTSTFDAKRKKFYLSAYPIEVGSSVTVTLDTDEQTEDEDFFVWYDKGLIEFAFEPAYIEPKQISISWIGGYAVTTVSVASVSKNILVDIPDGIKFAALLQTVFTYRTRLHVGESSIVYPQGSMNTFLGDLLPEVKSILLMYRKPAGEQ